MRNKSINKKLKASVPEGVNYFCDQCGYTAAFKSRPKELVKSVNEVVGYFVNNVTTRQLIRVIFKNI